MLAAMAMKWSWRDRLPRPRQVDDKPNLVTGANVRVCWEKFSLLGGRDAAGPDGGRALPPDRRGAPAHCDENTIAVVAILGSTFDGSYEAVKEIADALDQLEADPGCDSRSTSTRPPAVSSPRSSRRTGVGFRLPRVKSINASGHKYGLVYPASAWRRGGRRPRCPVISCSTSTTSAGHADFSLNFSPSRVGRSSPHLHLPPARPRGLHRHNTRPCRRSPCVCRPAYAESAPTG